METKVCSRCKKEKPIDAFAWKNKSKGTRNYHCKECQSLYFYEHYRANKKYYIDKAQEYKEDNREWFREFKKTLKCEVCGESDPCCLDFHHIDGDIKEYNISRMVSKGMSEEVIRKEISKCVILCANCHRKEHNK